MDQHDFCRSPPVVELDGDQRLAVPGLLFRAPGEYPLLRRPYFAIAAAEPVNISVRMVHYHLVLAANAKLQHGTSTV